MGADPLGGAESAGGEGIPTRGAVGQFKPLADGGKMDGVIAHDIAAAQRVHADHAPGARSHVAVAAMEGEEE